MGQCSFLLTVLAFRCPLSVHSQIDIGCGISVSTTSVQNKQPPACPLKASNPRRQESRNSAAPNERQQDIQQAKILCLATNLLHHGPQNRIQKTSRNMAARKGPRLYKKQIGTHREKKRVLTLTLMLVRRKSASKTSAGSCKILRWLTPLLGPNLDPKTGPKQSPKRRNVNVIQFRTPILGSIFGPKNGVSHRRILQLPADVLQADLRRTSMSVSVNTRFFSLCVPICFLYSNVHPCIGG